MEERAFNADTVVAYLEQEYDLTFTKTDERYYQAIYDNNIKAEICDSKYHYEERMDEPYVGLDLWNRKELSGCGIPCDNLEGIIKCIERYGISKKTGNVQLTLF